MNYSLSVKYCIRVFIIALVILLSQNNLLAQYVPGYQIPDSTFLQKHSPPKATFYSALVPGLGQVYNQKYWKVPIIYAGFTGLIYYAGYNNYVYNKYLDVYNIKYRSDVLKDSTAVVDDKYKNYSLENLRSVKDEWKRYRDLCFIGIGLLYVAQIIDANVDAHLFDYDISEDLSLRIEPSIMVDPRSVTSMNSSNTSFGLRCTFRFR